MPEPLTLIEWKRKAQEMLERSPDVPNQTVHQICLPCRELIEAVERIEKIVPAVARCLPVTAAQLSEAMGK